MNIHIKVGRDSGGAIKASQAIRNEVFVKEQGIPLDTDLDGKDKQAYHAVAYQGDKPIAAARLVIEDKKTGTLARVAVRTAFRGNGLAVELVRVLESKALELGMSRIDVYPHQYLRQYYEDLGYEYHRIAERVGHHRLVKMSKALE